MPNFTDELDRLVATLDRFQPKSSEAPDAIDFVLASPPRKTEARSLRHDPVVEAFRRELVDGLIRVDTANQLLNLVNTVLVALLTR